MKLTQWLIGLLLLLGIASSAAMSAQLSWDPKEFMGVDEITPGMTGYGKTVFLGTKVEKFDIEVVGVLKKIDFGFDMILVRVKNGPVVDKKFQTVEGMSGSPIYINDRMIGAYAYGWDFQQEAIAGVTPIANMLECSEPGSVTPPLVGNLVPRDKVLHIGDHLITRVKVASCLTDAQALQAKSDPTTMVLSPVATPLFVSGMSDAAMAPLQRLFARYNMEAMPGPGTMEGPAPKLEPGSAVAVSLMEGDANMSAVGTVTYVKGNTILCFGHPFTETGIPGLNIQMGNINLPMSAAYVHGILSSAKSSFKLASPMGRVGATTSDRQFAVAGELDKPASTVPVSLLLSQPERNFTRRYSVDLIQTPELTPILLYFFVLYNGAGQMGDPQLDQGAFTTRMILSTEKYGDIERNQIFSPMASQEQIPMMDFYLLPDALMMNPYESVKLNKVYIDLKYTHQRNLASIEKITPDRAIARPGDTVNFTVKLHPYDKPVETRNVAVKIPESANEPAMAVVIAGGTLDAACKPFIAPFPTPEEGTRGFIRWLTENNQPSTSLLTLQIFPTASYGYQGKMLEDLPLSLAEALHYNDTQAGVIHTDEKQGSGQGSASDALRPTASLQTVDTPYVLTGAQMALIAIDSDERTMQGMRRTGEMELNLPMPTLSASQISGSTPEETADEHSADHIMGFNMESFMSPVQREHFAFLKDCLSLPLAHVSRPVFPTWRFPAFESALPLSMATLASDNGQNGIEIQPKAADDAEKGSKSETTASDSAAPSASESEGSAKSSDDPATTENKHLLTPKVATWGLSGRKDFIRGKHLGTDVTSRGNLVIAPAVRSLYQTTEMLPWKVASAGKNIYLAGWNSNQVIHLDADNKSAVFFPKQDMPNVKTVSALTTEAAGNVLLATWPDAHVRLLSPDGALLHEWALPSTMIWDLAVSSDGKRYAACDGGTLYQLSDDDKSPLRVACVVPDKHVLALACGKHGEVYLATAPRGKVYCLDAHAHLTAVFEARGIASSLAVDDAGNVYVGTSPLCRVYRISPDGTQQMILHGVGRSNHTVSAMQFIGDTLYIATGPTGGIYRLSDPAGQDPEATVIFAREDQRTGNDEKATLGAESVFVNALAVADDGQLLAAASSPGQLLKLEPRMQGTFISPIMQAPTVSRWGQLDILTRANPGQSVSVDSRTGNTALPDGTWSDWQAVSKESIIVNRPVQSPAATYAQFRIRLNANAAGSPSLSYVKLSYRLANQTPLVRIEQPKPGLYWSGTKDIRWDASDPNSNELTYTVFTSRDNGKSWKQLLRPIETVKPESVKKVGGSKNRREKNKDKNKDKDKDKNADQDAATTTADTDALTPQAAEKQHEAEVKQKVDSEVREKSIPWDTKSTPDGFYRIKVVATNKYAYPTDPKSAECISDLFIVSNTPPTISVAAKVSGWEAMRRIEIKDLLAPVLGGKFNIDGGPWIALEPENGVFNGPDVWALLLSPDGEIQLTPGDHKVTIQAVDAANNVLDRTITVTMPDKTPAIQTAVPTPAPAEGTTPAETTDHK